MCCFCMHGNADDDGFLVFLFGWGGIEIKSYQKVSNIDDDICVEDYEEVNERKILIQTCGQEG